jgi:hypothetical protein
MKWMLLERIAFMNFRRFAPAVLAISLAACGGKQNPAAQSSVLNPQPSPANVTISSPEMVSMVALPSSAVAIGFGSKVVCIGPGGEQNWSFDLPNGDTVVSAPVGAPSSATFVRGAHALYALDPEGKLTWEAKDEDPGKIRGIVALGDSTVAVTHGDNSLVNYSGDGKPRWTFKLPDGETITALPVSAPSSTVYLRGNNTVYAVDPQGLLVWEKDLVVPPAK